MGKLIDLTGQRFGRLTVVERDKEWCGKDLHAHWICRCDCGNFVSTSGQRLRNKTAQSCGCFRKERMSEVSIKENTVHGQAHTKLYKVFYGMKDRCYNPKNRKYKDYGGRGITICDEWLCDFSVFYSWAVSNGYKVGLSIDRIDNDMGYSPNNCRWTGVGEQNSNKRDNHIITFQGETKTVSQWAEQLGVNSSVIYTRIRRGWEVEKVLTAPVQRKTKD